MAHFSWQVFNSTPDNPYRASESSSDARTSVMGRNGEYFFATPSADNDGDHDIRRVPGTLLRSGDVLPGVFPRSETLARLKSMDANSNNDLAIIHDIEEFGTVASVRREDGGLRYLIPDTRAPWAAHWVHGVSSFPPGITPR